MALNLIRFLETITNWSFIGGKMVEVHIECYCEVIHLGEDGISFCPVCECVCEGDTKLVSIEEAEEVN